jgi:hypothetical protein
MPMTRWERKEALGHGVLRSIARRTERSTGHVSRVIHGVRRDARVEKEIARRLKLPVEDVFPPSASHDMHTADSVSTAA